MSQVQYEDVLTYSVRADAEICGAGWGEASEPFSSTYGFYGQTGYLWRTGNGIFLVLKKGQ